MSAYGHEEQDAGRHRRERRTATQPRPYVATEPDDQRPQRGNEGDAIAHDESGRLRGGVGRAREEDHDDELDTAEALQIRERGAEGVDRHEEEKRPPRHRLSVPWPGRVAVAA